MGACVRGSLSLVAQSPFKPFLCTGGSVFGAVRGGMQHPCGNPPLGQKNGNRVQTELLTTPKPIGTIHFQVTLQSKCNISPRSLSKQACHASGGFGGGQTRPNFKNLL